MKTGEGTRSDCAAIELHEDGQTAVAVDCDRISLLIAEHDPRPKTSTEGRER